MTRGLAACLLAVLVLMGCSASDQAGIQDWITQQRAHVRPGVSPIAEPKTFVPQAYPGSAASDPFNSQKLTQALRRDAVEVASSALVKPELARPKQALEAVPLDTMVMVGSLVSRGQPVALIRIDRLVHPVRPGAYLGQNYGKVIQVTDTQVLLREIVQDASGEWMERATSLQLQEDKK